MQGKLVSTIDVGSIKISASLGKALESEEFDVLSVVSVPSKGVKKGFIVDKEKCKESFKEVIKKLLNKVNEELQDIYIGISNRGLRITETTVKVPISNNGIIRGKDIKKALTKSKYNITLLDGETVVDNIINYYTVDDKIVYDNVVGMMGQTLGVNISVIVGPYKELQVFKDIVVECGYNFKGFVVNNIAGRSIFIQGKKIMGVKILVDSGAGTTDIAIFRNGVLKYISSLNLGGNNLTNDLAICGELPKSEAENIKCILSPNYETLYNDDSVEDIMEIGTTKISKKLFYEVINARLDEIFKYVNSDIKNTSFCDGMCSIILYGNGLINYENINRIISEKIGIKTTIADSKYLGMKDTSNITSLAILKEVFDRLFLFNSEIKDINKESYLEDLKNEKDDNNNIDKVVDEKKKSGIISKIKRIIREYI